MPALKARAAWVFAALIGLASCAERDEILVGPREDIRPNVVSTVLPEAPVADRAIRLPAQVTNVDWTGPIGTRRAQHPALSAAPQLRWSTSIGEGNSRRARIGAPPVAGGGLIYSQDALATVTAVTPQGTVAWSFDAADALGETVRVSGGGMTYDSGVLYFATGYGALFALDAASGAVRWVQKLGATGTGSPLVQGGLVYLLAGDDRVWALRRDNGRVEWQLDGTSTVANVLGAPAPVWTGSLVVFAFGSGELQATFPQGGLVRWSASLAGQRRGVAVSRVSDLTGAPVVSGNTIYVANQSGRLAAFDASSGERRWTIPQGALDPVWPVGGSIFAVSDRNKLLRVNASNGEVIWAAELPGFVKDRPRRRGKQFATFGPILAGGSIVVASTDGFIRFYDPATGALRRSIEVPGGAASAPIVANQTLYILGGKGQLHAFR